MTKRKRRTPAPEVEAVQGAGALHDDEGVTLVMGPGRAFFAPPEPATLKRLGAAQREDVSLLQEHGLALVGMQKHLDELVERARDSGVSWHLIGWSLGMTGEGARQRWGVS